MAKKSQGQAKKRSRPAAKLPFAVASSGRLVRVAAPCRRIPTAAIRHRVAPVQIIGLTSCYRPAGIKRAQYVAAERRTHGYP